MRRYKERLVLVFIALVAAFVPQRRAHADGKPTVAVLYFDYSGKDDQMAVLRKGLAQMLISDLAGLDGIRLVERDRLEAVLAELKLAQTAKIDPQTAARVGKLLGAKYLVLGGYFDLMGTLRADARVVEVETGKVIESIGATGPAQDFLTLEQKLSDGLTLIFSRFHDNKAQGAIASNAAPHPRVPRPAKLKTDTALSYSKALDAIDHGDKPAAKKHLSAVVKAQPDFKLAALDMDRLLQ
jgi:TolB-like protein